jgi:hypothetical protein
MSGVEIMGVRGDNVNAQVTRAGPGLEVGDPDAREEILAAFA